MSKSKRQKSRKGRKSHATQERRQPAKASFAQERERGGLLVTNELEKALQECKSRVDEIAEDCKRRNRKFRDIEFDLENDRIRCLSGLAPNPFSPADVQRATQIFDKPSFFIDGADSNDIVQGSLGDCWFVSALATMSTFKGLVEKFCVARDEQVGVYGFIFFRDTSWVVVIIDDLLFTTIPKFEELNTAEKLLYHHDKQVYNQSARKSGKSLYFAKSGTNGETWVPLIEKAYAKLHGNYAALTGGEAGEAIEDLTGGVTSFIYTKDILDADRFWKDELLRANVDRLFGCSFGELDKSRSGDHSATVNGLIGGHAYSVLRAVEHNGKRFVVVRNPWGESEWTGPWSDGSKDWTPKWLPTLSVLQHSFGNDGQFVMEYGDFLENWHQIDRTLLFDSSWMMSSQWLKVTARPSPSAWGYGDVSFTISLPVASAAVIVLSKLDERYFMSLSGPRNWTFDFIVFRKGETKAIATSSSSISYSRSVNAEVYLEAGEYVLHVRLDRDVRPPVRARTFLVIPSTIDELHSHLERLGKWGGRLAKANIRTYPHGTDKESVNCVNADADFLPIPIGELAGQDLSELEAKAAAAREVMKKEKKALAQKQKPEAINSTNSEAVEATVETAESDAAGTPDSKEIDKGADINEEVVSAETSDNEGVETTRADESKEAVIDKEEVTIENEADQDKSGDSEADDASDKASKGSSSENDSENGEDESEKGFSNDYGEEDDKEDVVYLGLRVYTHKQSPAKIGGQLRHEIGVPFSGLAAASM